jgi:uncharacterized membrane protein
MFGMNDKYLQNWYLPPTWLRFLVIVLLVMGIFFRFGNIDRKLYWCDEAYTSLRMSGYLQQEVDRQLRDGRLLSVSDLHKYQYPNPDKSTLDTIKGLIAEESQLSPLYFVLVRWWVELFGNSITIVRSLSAFISLLTFPAIYWLCRELFKSPSIGWIAISIFAVSPVHIVYAQEARPYSLAIVATLFSSAALLSAMRLQTKQSWGIYIATITLGLYTQLFFGFVIIAQSIYVILIERLKVTKNLLNYIVSVGFGVMTFTPWAWIFITHPTPGNLSWVNTKQTFIDIVTRWVGIISRAFLDFGVGPNDALGLKIAVMPLVVIVFALIVYAIYFLCRDTPKQTWLFILVLIGSICVPLMVLDFGFGKRYGTTRYILPSTLGMQLAVAYLLSTKLNFITDRQWHQKIWAGIFCAVISIEIASCGISFQSQMWWNKFPELYRAYPTAAAIINRTDRALVITDADVNDLQVLGHLVNKNTHFQILAPNQIPQLNAGFSEVFLFTPSIGLKAAVEKSYQAPVTTIDSLLWKVSKAN